MKNLPLVSIIIASYNKEAYLKRCISSCLNQTYRKIEIILVDDNSTDNSIKIAKSFKNKLKIFKKKKFNINSKFNTFYQIDTYLYGLKKAKGEIIALLDSDDFFKSKKIENIVKHFKYKNHNVIFDKAIIYYTKNNFYKEKSYRDRKNMWPKFPPNSCITIKKNFFKKIEKELRLKSFSLLTIDFRIATISKILFNNFFILDEYLTYYFQDERGETGSKFKKFSKYWWKRREQAYEYYEYLQKKMLIKKNIFSNFNIDYIITKLINYLLIRIKIN